MSDASEKQFDATPSRIAKARREGNVARSQEFSANVAFIAAGACVAGIAPAFAAFARRAIADAARGAPASAQTLGMLSCAIAVVSSAVCAAAIASVMQAGGLTIVMPSFRFSRLAPVDGLKRMISRESGTHAVRALLAFVLAAVAVAGSVRSLFAVAASSNVMAVAATAWSAAQHVVFTAAGSGLIFAIVEYGAARRAWLAKLKMSLHELKREVKENDGDPATRARRKALHRNVLRGAISRVKDASFVVVNPTHVAVALEYRPPEVPVPIILVRAAGEMALRVRDEAARAGVPVIENVALARALFAHAEVGEPIPHEYYVAVAEIVAALIRTGALR